MAHVYGPMLSSFATGSFGKSITFKRRHGAFFLSKKIVHTGRLKPHEKKFVEMCKQSWTIRQFQGLYPEFYPDLAFGFASAEDLI